MANRRKFIAGLGALATGSAAAMGTGAFTTVTADRSVSVTVAGDANAYLSLDASSSTNNEYANESGDDGELSIDFDGITSGDNTQSGGGSGVNPNSVTTAKDVFHIKNKGTQPIEVDLSGASNVSVQDDQTGASASDDTVYFRFNSGGATSGSKVNVVDNSTAELGTGKKVQVDIEVAMSSSSPAIGDLTVTANAETRDDTDNQGPNA